MTTKATEKPHSLTNDHIDYLNMIRETGTTNPFETAMHLCSAFADLNKHEAPSIVSYWVDTFVKPQLQ